MTRVGLVGPGKVGKSIAAALPTRAFQLGPIISSCVSSGRRAARELSRGYATSDWAALFECDLVVVSVPDAAADEALAAISAVGGPGALPPTLCTGRTTGRRIAHGSITRFYPLRVFQRATSELADVCFAVSGNRSGIAAARRVACSIGGTTLVLEHGRLDQAVIGASLASDALTGVLELAVQRVVAAGAPRGRAVDAVRSVVNSSLDDYLRSGVRSRPGPLLEGRSQTVRHLLEGCGRDDPEASDLVRAALHLTLQALGNRDDAFRFLDAPVPAGSSDLPLGAVALGAAVQAADARD